MANPEHLAKLKEGVEAWNRWREENPDIIPELEETDLVGAALGGSDLAKADLARADLTKADLERADLWGANLAGVRLMEANLSKTNLMGANLNGANLRKAGLRESNLWRSTLLETILADVDLTEVKGLSECIHNGPSIIDHRTLTESQNVPLSFWRGVGLQDWQIEAAKLHNPKLSPTELAEIQDRVFQLRAGKPIQIHNLFISYTHADEGFIDHIEDHLRARSILFWRDKHDATAGPLDKIVVRAMDNRTVLLVLSEQSINSDWVEYEAQQARELEKAQGRHVLCPIALDDSWKHSSWSPVLHNQMMKYHILDFSDWQDETSFKGKFERLVKGLDLFYRE